MLLGTGCRLELDVNVDVAADGSGAVEVVVGLDPEALDKIGGDLRAVLDVEALEDAGWVLDGPSADSDGYHAGLRIRHPFGSPAEAARVFEQFAGHEGPFQDFAVTRHTLVRGDRVAASPVGSTSRRPRGAGRRRGWRPSSTANRWARASRRSRRSSATR